MMLEHGFSLISPEVMRISILPGQGNREYKVCYDQQEFLFADAEDVWRFIRLVQSHVPRRAGIAKQRELLQKSLRPKKQFKNGPICQTFCQSLSLV